MSPIVKFIILLLFKISKNKTKINVQVAEKVWGDVTIWRVLYNMEKNR